MKKIGLVFSLILCICFGLAACNNSEQHSLINETNAEPKNETNNIEPKNETNAEPKNETNVKQKNTFDTIGPIHHFEDVYLEDEFGNSYYYVSGNHVNVHNDGTVTVNLNLENLSGYYIESATVTISIQDSNNSTIDSESKVIKGLPNGGNVNISIPVDLTKDNFTPNAEYYNYIYVNPL